MDLNNVAMIMAPNLFLNNGKKSSASIREVELAKGTINIVRMLIKYHVILWTVCCQWFCRNRRVISLFFFTSPVFFYKVPSFMVRQVRYLYEKDLSVKSKEIKVCFGKEKIAYCGNSLLISIIFTVGKKLLSAGLGISPKFLM